MPLCTANTHLFLKQPKKSFYHLSIKWIIGNQSVNGFIFRNGDGHTLRIIINATSFLSVTFFFILSGPASSTYLMSILLVAISSYNLHFLWFQFKGWVKFRIIVWSATNNELFNNYKSYCCDNLSNWYIWKILFCTKDYQYSTSYKIHETYTCIYNQQYLSTTNLEFISVDKNFILTDKSVVSDTNE